MFTMLAALSEGRPLSTSFNSPSPLPTHWLAEGKGSCGGHWCPSNANPSWMNGQRTMWNGFGRSVNTYFVWLEEQIGAQKVVDMAKKLGIKFRSDDDATIAAKRPDTWGAFTLGVAAATPLDLANAYAAVAADGMYCPPLPVLSVATSGGAPVPVRPVCHQAVTPDVARAATDAARCPVGQQSASGRCDGATAPEVGDILKRPVAGKTGSSENNSTETFAGFTPQLAAAAIAANPDSPSDLVGAGIASSVNAAVARTMAAALQGQPSLNFTAPSSQIATGHG
jgi:membrane peptidoglycan carboxypeptidase